MKVDKEKKNVDELLLEQKDFFQNILDCVYDRIYVVDKNGVILMVNKASELDNIENNTKLVGRKMQDLVEEGFVKESLSLKVLETKKAQGIIHKENGGYNLLSWGVPYVKDGEIQFVVCTEWDLESLDTMQAFLSEERGLPSNVKSELTYYRSKSMMNLEMVAESSLMKELLKVAERSARSDATILIQGESGTGKEIIMRYIHSRSPRINAPLIEVNCGEIPENLIESELFGYVKGAFTGADNKGRAGLFELANMGTIFLDEIETLPLQAQAKLLRVLQEKEVKRVGGHISLPIDIKIIAASNINLEELVKEKKFREDLYYRLNVIPFYIPPLRERPEDIIELIRYFEDMYNTKYKMRKEISKNDYELFIKYNWPGNVRELQNIIERVILTSSADGIISRSTWERLLKLDSELGNERIKNSDPVKNMQIPINLKDKLDSYERELILEYLPQYKNSRQFSELLGVEKSTINRKIKKYNLKIPK